MVKPSLLRTSVMRWVRIARLALYSLVGTRTCFRASPVQGDVPRSCQLGCMHRFHARRGAHRCPSRAHLRTSRMIRAAGLAAWFCYLRCIPRRGHPQAAVTHGVVMTCTFTRGLHGSELPGGLRVACAVTTCYVSL